MSKKINELSQEIGISTENLKRFLLDFDLNISSCLSPDNIASEALEQFSRDNKQFLQDYSKDLDEEKTVAKIAEKIKQPQEKIEELLKQTQPNIFENGLYKSSISSYDIDQKLGGNYQFIYNYFGKKTPLFQKDFIGYNDLYFYILDMLEPFTDPNQAQNWGIQRAAGIILYGPPGSGKIFWGKKIAEIINYQFQEVRQSYLKTTLVDGQKTNFNDFLLKTMKTQKVILFLENFDQIMQEHGEETNVNSVNETTKDIVLHSIDKFVKEQLLMIGSANNISDIDPEIITSGRFDVLIPIFPPNTAERAKMILHYMTKDLDDNATLIEILKKNNADHLPFWNGIASQMKVFSNTMVIDFTQSLKKRLRSIYLKTQSETIIIDEPLLQAALKEAKGKLTAEYLDNIALFLQELSINVADVFASRIANINLELSSYMKKEAPSRSIGFGSNDNDESKKEDNS